MITFLPRLALSLLAFAGLTGAPAIAATPQTATAAAVTAPVPLPAAPALWKIADEDTTIYLFGTIHVLPQGIDWFDGKVAEAFAQSGSLVTEVAGQDDAAMQGLVIKLAMLPEGASLRDQLSAEQRGQYEAALTAFKLPPAMLDRFEPWYTAVALSTLPLMQEGFLPEHGVEQALEKQATTRKLPHTGLETSEYQLGLFDSLPADVQARYLGEVLGQLPTFKDEIRAMIEAWRIGDAEKLAVRRQGQTVELTVAVGRRPNVQEN